MDVAINLITILINNSYNNDLVVGGKYIEQ